MNAIYDISVEDKRHNLRYLLGISGERMLIVMGVNPSTADMNQGDPTMRRVEGFVKDSKYDGFMMLNIFPLRAKSPSKLPQRLGWRDDQKCAENIKWICKQLELVEEPVIWAAWGEGIAKRKYLARCLLNIYRLIVDYKPRWLHCGELTRGGHPRHPLYLNRDEQFKVFDMESYILSRTL
jgi:hypothetical protein